MLLRLADIPIILYNIQWHKQCAAQTIAPPIILSQCGAFVTVSERASRYDVARVARVAGSSDVRQHVMRIQAEQKEGGQLAVMGWHGDACADGDVTGVAAADEQTHVTGEKGEDHQKGGLTDGVCAQRPTNNRRRYTHKYYLIMGLFQHIFPLYRID